MKKRKPKRSRPAVTVLKWSLMAAAIGWTMLFRLGHVASDLPEFVYVNF